MREHPEQFDLVEIPLGEGPDEKTARLLRAPGVLRSASNVDFRQSGVLRKRRGYTRVDLARAVNIAEDSEGVWHNLATHRGELVLVGSDYVYALNSVGGNLTGEHTTATVSRRGPTVRGGYAIRHVVTSSIGDEQF